MKHSHKSTRNIIWSQKQIFDDKTRLDMILVVNNTSTKTEQSSSVLTHRDQPPKYTWEINQECRKMHRLTLLKEREKKFLDPSLYSDLHQVNGVYSILFFF